MCDQYLASHRDRRGLLVLSGNHFRRLHRNRKMQHPQPKMQHPGDLRAVVSNFGSKYTSEQSPFRLKPGSLSRAPGFSHRSLAPPFPFKACGL